MPNEWDEYDKERIELTDALLVAALVAIRKGYTKILKEVMVKLSSVYMRLEKSGELSYAEIKRFRDLERFQRQIMAQSTKLGVENKKILDKLLEETYDTSYSHMSYAIQKETKRVLKDVTPHLPEILAQVADNPIKGLRMEPALERDRGLIVKGINQAIEDGLKAGETYGSIAKRIQEQFDMSYTRAEMIAKTETHRVRERATLEGAMNSHNQGILMKKTWRNMGDQRVRPGQGIGKPKRKGGANHINMEGQERAADEDFNLIPSGTADCPGSSGIPSQDIRCRCYASYSVDRLESRTPQQAADNTEQSFKEWKKNNK